ncbi:MAG: hypothetical protein R3B96_09990 [Pirellulaceae bacterium]
MASIESPLWHSLVDELDRVRRRWFVLRKAGYVVAGCLALAATALLLRSVGIGGWLDLDRLPTWGRIPGVVFAGVASVFLVASVLGSLLVPRPPFERVVRGLEQRFPDLDSRLHALWSTSDSDSDASRFFRHQLIIETLTHARRSWSAWKSGRWVWSAQLCTLATQIVAGVAVAWLLLPFPHDALGLGASATPLATRFAASDWEVLPGDVELERGSDLRVTVRLPGLTLEPMQLVVREASGEQRYELEPNLSDPLYTASLPKLDSPIDYWVESSTDRSREFHVTLFERPRLLQFEVISSPPEYTGLSEETIQDPRHLQAVQGTRLTLRALYSGTQVRGTVAGVETRQELSSEPIVESEDGTYQTWLTTHWLVERDDLLVWTVASIDGREALTVPNLRVTRIPNRRPEVNWISPRQDLSAHPLQEFELQAIGSDDFGIVRYGFTILAGASEPTEFSWSSDAPPPLEQRWTHALLLEQLNLSPGRLVGLSAWVEDYDDSGQPRKTSSDLLFIDIRPYEWRFREEDPEAANGERQSGQQQSGEQQGQAAELAERQKQALIATWNLTRRDPSDDSWSEDLDVITEAQVSISEELRAMLAEASEESAELNEETRLSLERASIEAVDQLLDAANARQVDSLVTATRAQQTLLEFLISSAEEEISVRQSSSPSPSSGQRASGPSQQQLQSLELAANRNRYAQESEARERQEEQAGENRERLERLQELAQRQADLNQEIQEALEQQQTAAADELEERLERLRERQRELREDTEQLRAEMDRRADNAEQREQLDNARDAAR